FPASSFRVSLGVSDTAPRQWDGEALPASGQELAVEPDQLRFHKYAGAGGESGADPELPNDYVRPPRGWICSTRPAPMRVASAPPVIQSPSLLIHLRSRPAARPIEVRTAQGSFSFTPAQLALFRPAAFLDGAVLVERVPPVARAAEEQTGQQDLPALCATTAGELWTAWQEYDGAADAV